MLRSLLVSAVAALCAAASACAGSGRSSTLPAALSDQAFWELSARLSEPPGTFDSDNLVSNELGYARMARILSAGGGIYIGVGPEQNFSYIARLRPAMAFIVDIRQENRNLHLLYKALFELSTDRADFLSRLFSRERPAASGPEPTVDDLMAGFSAARTLPHLLDTNTRLVRERLLDARPLPLAPGDLAWIDHAFRAFYDRGPEIQYGRTQPNDAPDPTYRTLMTATDLAGERRSYLASEAAFGFVKALHAANMIVPVVGDFAGPDALRRTGEYVRRHGEVVRAFYASNVEVYLNRRQRAAFCGNLAALPYDAGTAFIGSKALLPLEAKLKSCAAPGR